MEYEGENKGESMMMLVFPACTLGGGETIAGGGSCPGLEVVVGGF